jgi:hypothetical protein
MESEGLGKFDRLMATADLRLSRGLGIGELYREPVRRQEGRRMADEPAEQRFPGATAAAS